jgi:nucleoside-diphosphate-sugar epimerase
VAFIVTGASGFIGRHLISHLAAHGASGRAISRQPCSALPPGWVWQERKEFLNGPSNALGDGVPTLSKSRGDIVVHLEAKHHLPEPTASDVEEFESVNVKGTQNWLAWCERNGVGRFIFFSSIKAVRPAETELTEEAPGPPESPYGASKWRAEQFVRRWAAAVPDRCALILRPAVVYGPGNEANIFAFVAAIARGRFCLVGRNENLKSVISVTNLCAAVKHVASRMQPGVQIYNLVDRETYTVRRLAEMISNCHGNPQPPRSFPLSIGRMAARLGDIMVRLTGRSAPLTTPRLKALLETSHFSGARLLSTGFVHPQTTEEGLEETVAWFKSKRRAHVS